MLINKVDVLPYFNFDIQLVQEYARKRNPNIKIIPICATTGEGVELFMDYLKDEVKAWKSQ